MKTFSEINKIKTDAINSVSKIALDAEKIVGNAISKTAATINKTSKDVRKNGFRNYFSYFYVKHILKSMYCPSCNDGVMYIDNSNKIWECKDCGYTFPLDEYDANYVFWYCDKCDAFLNIQDDFNSSSDKHICTKCGYENSIAEDNIKGVCRDCGCLLDNPKAILCQDCFDKYLENANDELMIISNEIKNLRKSLQ